MDLKNKLLYIGVFIIVIFGSISYFVLKNQQQDDNDIIFSEYYAKVEEENNYLESLLQNEYDETKSENPYILDGFHYVEGTVETGYVIEDESGNQFVWVPCNSENLSKKDFSDDAFIPISECWEEKEIYEKFLESSLENGGFYVSRFETGIEDEKLVSKINVETLVNVNRADIQEKIDTTFADVEYNIEIINGFAYDRMLTWVYDTCEDTTIIDTEIYPDEIFYTGRYSYNNIYDIFDDMYEITLENCFNMTVYRGFTSIYIQGLVQSFDNRYTTIEEYNYKNINISSRLVLYK